MSNNSNSSKIVVPQAREAMDKFKMEAASDLDVTLTYRTKSEILFPRKRAKITEITEPFATFFSSVLDGDTNPLPAYYS